MEPKVDEPQVKVARFDKTPSSTSNTSNANRLKLTPRLMDAFLKFGSVISYSEFHRSAIEAVQSLLPSAKNIQVHDTSSGNGRGSSPALNGWMKSALQHRERTEVVGEDLLNSEYKEIFSSATTDSCGVIFPAVDASNDSLLLLLTFVCSPLSSGDRENLDFLEKQIRVTHKRLERLHQSSIQPVTNATTTATSGCGDNHSIMVLLGQLTDSDSGNLQLKILNYLLKHTQAASGFIILRSADLMEMFCQVVGDKILGEEIRYSISTIHDADKNIFEEIIATKKPCHLHTIKPDKLKEFSTVSGTEVSSGLCVPLLGPGSAEVVALCCLLNKTGKSDRFTDDDVDVVNECFKYSLTSLVNTLAFETERKIKKQTQDLLQVAQNIFRKLDDLTVLLREIMSEARNLTHSERCSVFLLEKDSNELVAKVFDGLPTTDKKEQPVEIRIPATQGIAGYVATTGEMLNIKDAYSHPLFYSKVDIETGFRTRNILCFPIKDDKDSVVGVAQLCNKINGACFTVLDEQIAASFAVYCCISLMHSLMYKKVQDAHNRNKLATELMTYHMQVSEERVVWLSACEVPPVYHFMKNFTAFSSIPRNVKDMDGPLAVVSMFEDLNLCQRFRIPRGVLARFVLMVRRGYRDPPYHNWSHAFSVAHFAYLCIKRLDLENRSLLTKLEILSLFVAALCHDIDHRGTNNSFQMQSQSTLAALYSSEGSVLERHHFSQTVCILSSEGCNIFENLSRMDYQKVLDHIRDIILATDLAHHLRIIGELQQMADNGLEPTAPDSHYNLLCLLMTSADLSDQTKNWRNTRLVASLIYEEFFSQGDMEKSLGHKPAEGMDRDRANVPGLQVGFLDNIALPCYRILSQCFPEHCQCLVDQILHNRGNWVNICEMVSAGKISSSNSEIIFNSKLVPEDFDDETEEQ